MGPWRAFEDIALSLFCPEDVCDEQLVKCVNVDVTAAGCSHPVSSACHYQPPSSSSSFKAAAAAAACHAHFNTPDSFDRLYGLIILNIYRSHFPKPSMFIQHLGDHSTAPFSTPSSSHNTQSYFLPILLLSPSTPRLALLQPSFSFCYCLNKKKGYFSAISSLSSPPLAGHPLLQWLGHRGGGAV